MTTAEYLRSKGLPKISEIVEISTFDRTTLDRWHKEKPQKFHCMAMGCAAIKAGYDPKGIIEIKQSLIEIKKLLEEKQ